jgi:hypothetical protein
VGGVLVDTGPLRRHPGFRRLWAGQLVASLGSQLTVVAVAYQTYRLTGSTAMVGLVSLSGLVPLLAGSVLGGPAVDAWDRRKVLLATQVLLAAGAAGLAVNAMLGHPRLWPVFACTIEAAAFQSVDWAARRRGPCGRPAGRGGRPVMRAPRARAPAGRRAGKPRRRQEPPDTAWAGPWPKVPPGAVIAPPSSPPPSSPGCWLAADGWTAGVVVVPFTAVTCAGPGSW